MPSPPTTVAAEIAAAVTALPPLRPTLVDFDTAENPSQQLHNALLENGFVAIRNCGVDRDQLKTAFATARAFFAQPPSIKNTALYQDTQENFGYQPLHSEALDPTQAADAKETFTMRNIISRSTPIGTLEGFGDTANSMFSGCRAAAMRIIGFLETALELDKGTIANQHTGENMTLRYLHYPKLSTGHAHAAKTAIAPKELSTDKRSTKSAPKTKKSVQLGAGAHTDYGTITLLFSDGVAGLQLYDSAGDWRDVEVAAGDVLVNTGDLMALWSNGLYPSTLHRVVTRESQPARYSLAFFVDPDSATRVSPLPQCITEARPAIASEVVAGEHIQARIEASQR